MRAPTRLVLSVLVSAAPLAAQGGAVELPPITIAERRPGPVAQATAAVTRLTADQLAAMPHTTVLDLLRLVPGFSSVDGDGSGTAGHLRVRGFYGGGEAEYVVVLVDGRPVNHLASGLVAWDALPPVAAIAAIEVLRGGSSALYGDAAIGGVLNVITHQRGGGYLSLHGGDPAVRGGSLGLTGEGWRAPHLSLSLSDRDGGRAHAARTTGTLSGSVGLLPKRAEGLAAALGVAGTRRDFEEPGPLAASVQQEDFSGSDPLYRFDHSRDDTYRGWIDLTWQRAGADLVQATVGAGWRASDATRTLVLMPGMGDTKRRRFENRTLDARLVLDVGALGVPGLRLGSELADGDYTSRYAGVIGGPREAYLAGVPSDEPLTRLTGQRTTVALFAQHVWQPNDRVRVTSDLRHDRVGGAVDDSTGPTRSAWSPRLGVNVGYRQTAQQRGHVYATVGRSFKAATLDQLHDDRPITGLPITMSNPALSPQRGTTAEVGVHHELFLGGPAGSHTARLTVTASAYTMAMRDEIDFDVATFRYVNIGRSRHEGVESGVALQTVSGWSVFGNLTVQRAVSRAGDDQGKDLKAVPRRSVDAGIRWAPSARGHGAVVVTSVGPSWLDGGNTQHVAGYTVADLQGSYQVFGERLQATVALRNLFDRAYNSSGFPDAAGTSEVYWYPAARRSLELTLTTRW